MRISFLLAAATFLMAGTAVAAAPQNTSSSNEGAAKEKRVCKSEKITGSLTRVRRVCMTQREWDQLSENAQRGVNDISRDASRNQMGQQ
jgi:hypothetical protein